MKLVWITLNVLVASWLSHTAFFNTIFVAVIRRWGNNIAGRALFALLLFLLVVHGGLAWGLAVFAGLNVAIIATSLLTLVWSLICYFMMQRFAGPLDRTGMVDSNPAFYPALMFVAFVGLSIAVVLFAGWLWLVLPIGTWFVLGFLCAEAAIRRYMRKSRHGGSESDRDLAIFAINNAQGRGSMFRMKRYPFP